MKPETEVENKDKDKDNDEIQWGGYSPEFISALRRFIPANAEIVELGSGYGSARLADYWHVVSVEHDLKWARKYPVRPKRGRCIYAPIAGNWYSISKILEGIEDYPHGFHAVIIDGPPGTIGREGFLKHWTLFRRTAVFVFDDINRDAERALMEEFCRVSGKSVVLEGNNGLKRFAIVR